MRIKATQQKKSRAAEEGTELMLWGAIAFAAVIIYLLNEITRQLSAIIVHWEASALRDQEICQQLNRIDENTSGPVGKERAGQEEEKGAK